MKLTKKVNGHRAMAKVPNWWCLNESTPDSWFDKWNTFTCHLMVEIGFKVPTHGISKIEKPKGKVWNNLIIFKHEEIGILFFYFERKRKEKGGVITIRNQRKDQEADLNIEVSTISIGRPRLGDEHMSRVDVGEAIISSVRSFWELKKENKLRL